jgi:hypothetical protein
MSYFQRKDIPGSASLKVRQGFYPLPFPCVVLLQVTFSFTVPSKDSVKCLRDSVIPGDAPGKPSRLRTGAKGRKRCLPRPQSYPRLEIE